MTSTTTSRLAITATLMSLIVILEGCGGGGGSAPAPAPAPAPTPTPAPVPAPAPGPAGDLSSTIAPTTYTASGREALAYQALNSVRQAGGFGTVAQNSALDSEAVNQAAFVAANYTIASGFGGLDWNAVTLAALQPDGTETGHDQTLSNLPGYTGYSPTARAVHFGYATSPVVAEDASFFTAMTAPANGTSCVTDLLRSPGHRENLLDPRFRDVGIGYSTLSQPFDSSNATLFGQSCYFATAAKVGTYSSTGLATAPSGWIGIYPADASTVSSTNNSHGHGFAPSVTVDSNLALITTTFTVVDSNGNTVPTTLNVDAQSKGYANWAFATPNAALALNTTYTVNFVGTAGGKAVTKTWTFTTPAQ